MLKDKLILVDCDGVILDWEWSFDRWMFKHGYTKQENTTYNTDVTYGISEEESNRLIMMFNESVHIRKLPPFKQAIKYIKKLHEEHGYVFHAITSVGDEPDVVEARNHNLKTLFGESAFIEVSCLNFNISKHSALKQYQDTNCWWIEDHPKNVFIGYQLGLNCLMVDHRYNQSYNALFDTQAGYYDARVYDWEDIYKRIINGQTYTNTL